LFLNEWLKAKRSAVEALESGTVGSHYSSFLVFGSSISTTISFSYQNKQTNDNNWHIRSHSHYHYKSDSDYNNSIVLALALPVPFSPFPDIYRIGFDTSRISLY